MPLSTFMATVWFALFGSMLFAQLSEPIQTPQIETPVYSVFISSSGSDAASGDSAFPLASFNAAISKIDSLSMSDEGSVYAEVVLLPGYYPFAMQQGLNKYNRGKRTLNISIRGIKDVFLDGSSLSMHGGEAMIRLLGSGIFIKNITILYSPSHGIRFGYNYNGMVVVSHDVLIENVRVQRTAGHGIEIGLGKMKNNTTPEFLPESKRFMIRNCEVDLSVNHNDLSKSQWGSAIKISNVRHATVDHCVVHDNGGEGIDLVYGNFVRLSNNTVYDNRANIYLDKAEDCIIENNLIYNESRSFTGLLLSTEAISVYIKDHFVRNIFVQNNVFLNSPSPIAFWQGTIGGLQSITYANVHITHNTFIGKQSSNNGIYHFAYEKGFFGGVPSNVRFSNLSFTYNIIGVHPDSVSRPLVTSPLNPQPELRYGYNLWSQDPQRAYNAQHDTIVPELLQWCAPTLLNRLVPDKDSNAAFYFPVPVVDYITYDKNDSLRYEPLTNAGAFEWQSQNFTHVTEIVENIDPNISLYPIPASSTLTVKSNQLYRNYVLYNMQGGMIKQASLLNGTIEVDELSKGTYLLQLNNTSLSPAFLRFSKD